MRRLAGTGALHHLLGLLLSHAALCYRLEQPERARGEERETLVIYICHRAAEVD